METAQDIYDRQIKRLPVVDRLQLARLIMDDLVDSAPNWTVEINDAWSEEDLYDLSRASLRYASHRLADTDENAEAR